MTDKYAWSDEPDRNSERKWTLRGSGLNNAPLPIRSFLDCVDGAMGLYSISSGGRLETVWALYRGGIEVGQVRVAHE